MPRKPRYQTADPSEVQCYHLIQRCVRRAFLCGEDRFSGQSYEHRRGWIRDRLEFLASVFGIDCLTYTVLSNHLHLVLRSRPDVVAQWSDQEVARRWLRLFPHRRNQDGTPEEPTKPEIDMIVNQVEALAERRRRLSDISWWMRCAAENIARRANREDECTGRFWEGRFKLQVLLDEASLLACAAYVDLNPVRAAIAETPETSDYTGAKDRIDDLAERQDRSRPSTHDWERSRRRRKSGWMSPIEVDEKNDAIGPCVDSSGRRASTKGFLAVSMARYLELLDWTGRQLHRDKVGKIPDHLAPILSRIGLDTHGWCDIVKKFGRVFKRAAGTPENLAREAVRCGQGWMCAPENPLGMSAE
jgi:REP element-mobilizing transposase RayT